MPENPALAAELFLTEAFFTIDAVAEDLAARSSAGDRVESWLVFETARLRDASALAADLRRITRRPVRVRLAPLRRRWTISLTTSPAPMTVPLVELLERRMHDLVRQRAGCRFVGSQSVARPEPE